MPYIDTRVVCRHLVVDRTVRPMTQRNQKVCKEKISSIDQEVKKLANVGFIIEIKYTTWLANIVLVKKSSTSDACAWILPTSISLSQEPLTLARH